MKQSFIPWRLMLKLAELVYSVHRYGVDQSKSVHMTNISCTKMMCNFELINGLCRVNSFTRLLKFWIKNSGTHNSRTHTTFVLWITYFLHCNWYLLVIWIFLLWITYCLHCNWYLWRKTSTVAYREIWLNRVTVHWLLLFNNLILYSAMFELQLFL